MQENAGFSPVHGPPETTSLLFLRIKSGIRGSSIQNHSSLNLVNTFGIYLSVINCEIAYSSGTSSNTTTFTMTQEGSHWSVSSSSCQPGISSMLVAVKQRPAITLPK